LDAVDKMKTPEYNTWLNGISKRFFRRQHYAAKHQL